MLWFLPEEVVPPTSHEAAAISVREKKTVHLNETVFDALDLLTSLL
jgi:hypothetical protein